MAIRLAAFCLRSPLLGMKTVHTLRVYRHGQEYLRQQRTTDAREQAAWTADQLGYSVAWVNQCVREWMETRPLPVLARARFPGLVETLEWARCSDIELGILSDYKPEEKLRALKIEKYFSVVVSAQEMAVGRFKPDPRGLLVALERLQVEPEYAVYIGDRLDIDYPTAAAVGVPCCIMGKRALADKTQRDGLTILPSWAKVLEWLKARATIT